MILDSSYKPYEDQGWTPNKTYVRRDRPSLPEFRSAKFRKEDNESMETGGSSGCNNFIRKS